MVYTVSLQKGHKILNMLKQIKNQAFSLSYSALKTPITVGVTEGYQQLLDNANSAKADLEKNIALELAAIEAIASVKSAIFKANIESGVSDLIEEYAAVQQIIQVKRKVIDASKTNKPKIQSIDSDKFAQIAGVEIENRSQTVKFDLKLIEPEFMVDDIKDLSRRMVEISDKKTEINSQFKVTFEIPDILVEELTI